MTAQVTTEELKKAVKQRSAQFLKDSETLTLKMVRRILEEHMGLAPKGLDSHKDEIRSLINDLLTGATSKETKKPAKDSRSLKAEGMSSDKGERKKGNEKRRKQKGAETSSKVKDSSKKNAVRFAALEAEGEEEGDGEEEGGEGEEGEYGEVEDDQEKVEGEVGEEEEEGDEDVEEVDGDSEEEDEGRGKKASKEKRSHGSRQKEMPSQKRKHTDKSDDEPTFTDSDRDSGGDEEDDDEDDEEPRKRRRTGSDEDGKQQSAASIQSPEVTRLKSLFAQAGLRIPPVVYKRAHATSRSSGTDLALALEQELKGALRKEGLSSHPSESELRALKRKKEKEKELDGIDTSNILGESRGRRSRAGNRSYTYVDNGSSEEEEEEEEDEDAEESDAEDALGSDDGEGGENADASD